MIVFGVGCVGVIGKSGIIERRDAGQLLAFEKLERSATAG
jgi:hypothetical protein